MMQRRISECDRFMCTCGIHRVISQEWRAQAHGEGVLERRETPTYVGVPYQTFPDYPVCMARRRPSFLAQT